MTDDLATVRASSEKLRRVIRQGSARFHEDILFRVGGNRVETLMQTNARAVVTYCSWDADYFDAVEGEARAILPVGGTGADSRGLLDYMDFVDRESGTVEFTFQQDDQLSVPSDYDDLATHWQAEGALNARLRLPSSEDDVEAIPWDHPVRWTPDEEYASKECLTDEGLLPDDADDWITMPTTVVTSADVVNDQIIGPADLADGVKYRPIIVEDGEFTVSVEGSQANDAIWGEVNAESVEGPDVDRQFPEDGFDDIFGVLAGQVRLQTAPQGESEVAPPMTVVQDNYSDRTIRHLVGALEG